MDTIAFATGNTVKFVSAQHICKPLGIELEQVVIDIDEIQGENPELIIKAKARAAFDAYQKPVVVSDDTWDIPALRGFPGAYMKSMNYWFTPEDFLRLMADKSDRSAILHQSLAYIDEHGITIFNSDLHGQIVEKPRGNYDDNGPWMKVVAMEMDDGKTLAEVWEADKQLNPDRYKNILDSWRDLVKWYKDSHL